MINSRSFIQSAIVIYTNKTRTIQYFFLERVYLFSKISIHRSNLANTSFLALMSFSVIQCFSKLHTSFNNVYTNFFTYCSVNKLRLVKNTVILQMNFSKITLKLTGISKVSDGTGTFFHLYYANLTNQTLFHVV